MYIYIFFFNLTKYFVYIGQNKKALLWVMEKAMSKYILNQCSQMTKTNKHYNYFFSRRIAKLKKVSKHKTGKHTVSELLCTGPPGIED